MPDDDLTNPPTTYSMISRVQKRDLQIGIEPQTKLQEIEDEFRARYPAYALWSLTVNIIRSFAIGGSGVLRWFYRLIGQSVAQVVTVEFETFGEFGDEEDTPFPINLLVTTSDGLPVAVAGSVTVIDTETGTAVEGVDYNWPGPLVIPIPMGTLSGALIPFDLDVIDNLDPENNVSVILQVGTPVDCVIGSQNEHTHIINDTDPGIYASYSFSTGTALRSVTPVEVKIKVYTSDTNPTNQASSVDITDTGLGTAVEGVDYNFAGPTTINIPMGTPDGTEFSFFLDVIDTAPTDVNKTVKLGLGSPVKLVPVGPNTHTQTIQPNAPVITNTTLNDATQSQLGYSDFVLVDFGTRPLANFAVTVGSLPTGLTLDNLTGEIYGDLDAGATDETFTVTVTDDDGRTDSQSYTITVYDALVFLTADPLPDGETGLAYAETVFTDEGKAPRSIVLLSGTLPHNLTGVDDGAGNYEITGTPDTVEDATFVLRVTDDNGAYLDKTYTLSILAPAGLPGTPTLIYDRANLNLTVLVINTILDGSGNGYDAAYVSGTKANLDTVNTLNGDSTIRPVNNGFNDGSLYRTAVGNTWADVMASNRGTIMGVINVDSILALFGAPDHIIGNFTGAAPRIDAINSGGVKLRFRWDAGGTVNSDVSISLDTWYVFTARADGTNVKMQADNGTETSNAGGDLTVTDGRIQLFFDGGDAGCFNGNMAFMPLWDGGLSGSDVTQAKNYMKSRWAALNV